MKFTIPIFFLSLVVGGRYSAAEDDTLIAPRSSPAKLARAEFEQAAKKAEQECSEKLDSFRKAYAEKLGGILKATMASGDLEESNRIDAEIKSDRQLGTFSKIAGTWFAKWKFPDGSVNEHWLYHVSSDGFLHSNDAKVKLDVHGDFFYAFWGRWITELKVADSGTLFVRNWENTAWQGFDDNDKPKAKPFGHGTGFRIAYEIQTASYLDGASKNGAEIKTLPSATLLSQLVGAWRINWGSGIGVGVISKDGEFLYGSDKYKLEQHGDTIYRLNPIGDMHGYRLNDDGTLKWKAWTQKDWKGFENLARPTCEGIGTRIDAEK